MSRVPEVTIIIPNYNGKKLLENCIKTLEHQTCQDFLLLVVDNGSTDGSVAVTSDVIQMEMIALSENTGFCGAVNIGIAHAKTPYVILLNNDTEAEEGFVEHLLAGIKESETIFSCSAMMIDYHNRALIDNAGDYYNILGWANARGKGKEIGSFAEARDVFSSCGGASIYRRELLEQIGTLDERHFAYLEDVDLGYRAKIFGYRNRYIPQARVYHVGSATTGARYSAKKVFLAARNSIYVIYKNMPILQLLMNLPFLLAGILIKTLFFTKKGFAKEYLRGIKEGIFTCRDCSRVKFRAQNLGHYVGIQFTLWLNIFRVLFAR